MMEHKGDIAYVLTEGQVDYKRIWASKRELALYWPQGITILPGYGVVPVGTVMAKVTGGTRAGYYVPYNPNPNGSTDEVTWEGARAYLVTDSGTGQTVYVGMNDSYRFAVGDIIVIDSDGGTPYQLTVTAVDRTTYTHMAGVTFTGTISVSHTVAHKAHICIDGEGENTYSKAKGIPEQAVDTGTGVNSKGGLGVLILKNGILHNGMLQNADSAARTDLSATLDGNFLFI